MSLSLIYLLIINNVCWTNLSIKFLNYWALLKVKISVKSFQSVGKHLPLPLKRPSCLSNASPSQVLHKQFPHSTDSPIVQTLKNNILTGNTTDYYKVWQCHRKSVQPKLMSQNTAFKVDTCFTLAFLGSVIPFRTFCNCNTSYF